MEHALDLARKGVGLASPNPTVGCVIVKDGTILGEGFHQYEWRNHAEIVALKQAGVNGAGSDAVRDAGTLQSHRADRSLQRSHCEGGNRARGGGDGGSKSENARRRLCGVAGRGDYSGLRVNGERSQDI